jgi:hypothetical protein
MVSIATWTRQHRVVAFFGAAFVLSWWAWPLYALDLSPAPFFACGPLIAALVVIGVTEGWSGYRTLGARMIAGGSVGAGGSWRSARRLPSCWWPR